MITRIMIDPNVRVRGNGTYAGFEDVRGPVAVGMDVQVYEPEAGIFGNGRVNEIDTGRKLVYLSVDWESLTETGYVDFDEKAAQRAKTVVTITLITTLGFAAQTWAAAAGIHASLGVSVGVLDPGEKKPLELEISA